MKKIMMLITSCLMVMQVPNVAHAQANELAQLALNVEKLAQFKGILEDLKKGYQIVHTGYSTIKNLSEGNFNLHQLFLDGLLQVSPSVKKYRRIPDIINGQIDLVRQYKHSLRQFKTSNQFRQEEIDYITVVYSNLFNSSLKSLDELINIITANKLRMSDDERLKAIDQIYLDMEDKREFLNNFNSEGSILAIQRFQEYRQINTSKIIYGLTK